MTEAIRVIQERVGLPLRPSRECGHLAWTWPAPRVFPEDPPQLGEYFYLMDITPPTELAAYHYHVLRGDPYQSAKGPLKLFPEEPGGGFFSERQLWAPGTEVTSLTERTAVLRALARARSILDPPFPVPGAGAEAEPPPHLLGRTRARER